MALIAGAVAGTYVIGNMFASSAKLRAQKEAARILNEARLTGIQAYKDISAQFDPFLKESTQSFSEAGSELSENRGLLMSFIEDAKKAVPVGFSDADQIALKDAQRLMNENLVSTGNLRSGVAGYYNMDLAKRFAADVSSRSFERNLARTQLLFGGGELLQRGTSQRVQLGSNAGSIGVQGKGIAAQLLQASMGITPAAAAATSLTGEYRGEAFGALANAPMNYMQTLSGMQDLEQSQAYTAYLKKRAA